MKKYFLRLTLAACTVFAAIDMRAQPKKVVMYEGNDITHSLPGVIDSLKSKGFIVVWSMSETRPSLSNKPLDSAQNAIVNPTLARYINRLRNWDYWTGEWNWRIDNMFYDYPQYNNHLKKDTAMIINRGAWRRYNIRVTTSKNKNQ